MTKVALVGDESHGHDSLMGGLPVSRVEVAQTETHAPLSDRVALVRCHRLDR